MKESAKKKKTPSPIYRGTTCKHCHSNGEKSLTVQNCCLRNRGALTLFSVFPLLLPFTMIFLGGIVTVGALITVLVSVFGFLAAGFQNLNFTVFYCVILMIDILKNIVKFFRFVLFFFFSFFSLMLCVCVQLLFTYPFVVAVVEFFWVDKSFFICFY